MPDPIIESMKKLVFAAQKAGIRLVPVDDVPVTTLSLEYEKKILSDRNRIIAINIMDNLSKLGKDEKAIGLFGLGHSEISQLLMKISSNTRSKSYALMEEQFYNSDTFRTLRIP